MAGQMTLDEEIKLFHELIVVSRKMARQAHLVGETIDERFQNRISEPLADLNAVLARCPAPELWDGNFVDEDFEVNYFHSPNQSSAEEKKGAIVRHRFTGISGQSYTKQTAKENLAVARKYVEEKVREELPVR